MNGREQEYIREHSRSRSPNARYPREFAHRKRQYFHGPNPSYLPDNPMGSKYDMGPTFYSKPSRNRTYSYSGNGAEIQDENLFDWNEILSFKRFVILRVSENASTEDAVIAYERYLKTFNEVRLTHFVIATKNFPVIYEYYNYNYLKKEFQEMSEIFKVEASNFVKLLAEEHFMGLHLVEVEESSIDDTANSRIVKFGEKIDPNSYHALCAPYWLPNDPDINCICIRKLNPKISKHHLTEYIKDAMDTDEFIDVSVTESRNFMLTLQGGTPYRTAWIRFKTDEACTAAELKLDGARINSLVIHDVLRKAPNINSYFYRVTPSEACHPARIQRDLILSARLILKYDDIYGVTDLLGGKPDSESFEERCAAHPVLSELSNVLNGFNRNSEDLLDLQLLYLRLIHAICYYSGKKFKSFRHLWIATGGNYVRPNVNYGDVLQAFRDFEDAEGQWDSVYADAKDLETIEDLKAAVKLPLFFPENSEYLFEPNKTDQNTSNENELKKTNPRSMPVDSLETRGRHSNWLKILDSRIAYLLLQDYTIIKSDAEHPLIEQRWNDYCERMIEQITEAKWKCGLCIKQFRGPDFVKKHLRNKHPEQYNDLLNEVNDELCVEAYKNDPFKFPLAPAVKYSHHNRRNHSFHGDSFKHMETAASSERKPESQYRDLDAPPKTVRLTGDFYVNSGYQEYT